ncbi:hypothetical protein KKC45_02365 [Patescibacteria group bacterium]|nr:hypothetical protein [Patescibacteria group bacterium]
MNKKELTQKLMDIDENLKAFGNLDTLIQDVSSKKQIMDTLIAQLQAQKVNIDAIPVKKQEIDNLMVEIKSLKESIVEQQNLTEEAKTTIDTLKDETEKIHDLSLDQLGVISNEKLSNSFDKVKNDLRDDNKKWFRWLFGTSVVLLLAVIGVVIWQVEQRDTIFEISFLVKLALTSPIIFFEFFVNREYSRSKKLIEEYEFKASIARSFEAYKEIIEDLFADQPGVEYQTKLNFILESIGQLYSSPMKNIKDNNIKGDNFEKKMMPIMSDIKNIISDAVGVLPKNKINL